MSTWPWIHHTGILTTKDTVFNLFLKPHSADFNNYRRRGRRIPEATLRGIRKWWSRSPITPGDTISEIRRWRWWVQHNPEATHRVIRRWRRWIQFTPEATIIEIRRWCWSQHNPEAALRVIRRWWHWSRLNPDANLRKRENDDNVANLFQNPPIGDFNN